MTAHVRRWCDHCEEWTGWARSQWADPVDGIPLITTEWMCTQCKDVDTSHDPYPPQPTTAVHE